MSTDGIDAAMAVIRQTEETPLVATFGMTAEEAARQPVSSSPSGGARAVRISYRYDEAGDSAQEPGWTADSRRRRRPAPRGPRGDDRDARGLLARGRPRAGGRGDRRARDARPDERARDPERPGVPRGAPARGRGRAHRRPQPALLPRDARARMRQGPSLRARHRARHPRHRRLQGDERPPRAPRRRRGPGGGRRAAARGGSPVRHRLPRRRRRVRRHPPRGRRARRRAALPQDPVRRRLRARRGRPSACVSPPASPSSGPRTTRCRSSSAPTRPSTGRRRAARARCSRRRARRAASPSSPARARHATPRRSMVINSLVSYVRECSGAQRPGGRERSGGADLLPPPDEGAHVFEEARAVRLELGREEMPRRR